MIWVRVKEIEKRISDHTHIIAMIILVILNVKLKSPISHVALKQMIHMNAHSLIGIFYKLKYGTINYTL